ncbi:hypothetical protein [Vibrio algicola]|uniref:DUF3306 domain-containing protein n=1 Tax=Vibrio algicola TaxID=2662262 RepID=A0A5Q0TFL9_9VIBR|nr:hypothetical protein [Vibrio algicola]
METNRFQRWLTKKNQHNNHSSGDHSAGDQSGDDSLSNIENSAISNIAPTSTLTSAPVANGVPKESGFPKESGSLEANSATETNAASENVQTINPERAGLKPANTLIVDEAGHNSSDLAGSDSSCHSSLSKPSIATVAHVFEQGFSKGDKKKQLRDLFLGGEFSDIDPLDSYNMDYSAVKSISQDVASTLRSWHKRIDDVLEPDEERAMEHPHQAEDLEAIIDEDLLQYQAKQDAVIITPDKSVEDNIDSKTKGLEDKVETNNNLANTEFIDKKVINKPKPY